MIMISKRIFILVLFTALAVMPMHVLRAQWVQTNGPIGGFIESITVSGSNIYADGGWHNSHIFLSMDTGLTWKPFVLWGNEVQSIAGCGSYLFAWTQDSFYVSSNNGRTWTEDSNWRTSKKWYLGSFVQSGSIIYSGGGGVFRSTDSGFTWTNESSGLPRDAVTGIAAVGTNLFVGLCCDSGLFRSTDSGATWTRTNSNFGTVQALAAIGTNLFVDSYDTGILLSTDYGDTWMASGLRDHGGSLLVYGSDIYAGSNRSTDSGKSWVRLNVGYVGQNVPNSIAVLGPYIFAGTDDGGIYRSTEDSASGELVGLPSLDVSSLFTSGNNLIAEANGYFTNAYISTNEGLTWNLAGNWVQNGQVYCPFDSTIFALGISTDDYLAASNDNGVSWIPANLPNTMGYYSLVRMGKYLFVATEQISPSPPNIYVFRSSDGGINWIPASTGLPSGIYGSSLSVLTGNRLICAADVNFSNMYVDYVSSDFGVSWNFVDSSRREDSTGLCCPAPTPVTQMGIITFGIDSGELYRSYDDGLTWMLSVNPNDSLSGINSAVATGNNLFICAKSGNIFLSTDTGATWKHVNDGLSDSSISFLAVTGQYLFAANANDSFWRRPLSDLGISAVAEAPPIKQNIRSFPNPFSQSTQITFTTAAAGYADVSIVNLLGAEVAHLYSGELAAGNHSFPWSKPAGLPDGMYECLVRMNGRVETLPMILTR